MAQELDLRQLQLSLDKKKPESLYLIYGEETFLVDEALTAIKRKALLDGAVDFNYDSFFSPETTAAQVRDVIETLPMMCERRLVVFKNVENVKDDDWENLFPVFENPIDTCTAVFVANKIDKRKKFLKKLQGKCTFVSLKKPYENQIPMWIEYIAYLNDVKVSKEALAALQQLVGTNLSGINNEINKIKLFLGPQAKAIELKDVLQVVSRSRIENVSSLTDAIAKRNRPQALLCLANLLENGQNEVGILSLIYRQMRILMAVYEGKKLGLGGSKLSEKVGVPEFFMKQYMEQARLWDEKKLVSTVKALHETDKALKSSPVAAHIWLENFIVRTC